MCIRDRRKPADKEVFQTPPGLRIRALLAGHLPDDGATHVKARQWLATIVPEGQQFFVGNDFWVAVILSNSDENARQQGRHITANIAKCYGDEMPVRAQMVDETFVLSQSCLDGTSPPPFTVLSLLEQLARARRDETSQDYRGT